MREFEFISKTEFQKTTKRYYSCEELNFNINKSLKSMSMFGEDNIHLSLSRLLLKDEDIIIKVHPDKSNSDELLIDDVIIVFNPLDKKISKYYYRYPITQEEVDLIFEDDKFNLIRFIKTLKFNIDNLDESKISNHIINLIVNRTNNLSKQFNYGNPSSLFDGLFGDGFSQVLEINGEVQLRFESIIINSNNEIRYEVFSNLSSDELPNTEVIFTELKCLNGKLYNTKDNIYLDGKRLV